jgi:hypothetical protein
MLFRNFKIILAIALVGVSFSQPGYSQTPKSEDVSALRKQGQSGLETFLLQNQNQLNSPKVRAALDTLCQQRDCYASKLYWYTDLEQAKEKAKATGKPILSLRLLGKLDQDLSCANSRFFRVALYPNGEISKFLRDHYILHWQSVRPAPKVTIDFGDGRKLERTVTGNSIHYILDSSGRPIDAIPGLYGPKAFLRQLQTNEVAVKEYSKLSPKLGEAFLRKYHSELTSQRLRYRLNSLQSQLAADLSKLGISSAPRLGISNNSTQPPSATTAGSIAVSKMRVENPLLNRNAQVSDEATWNRIAQLYINDAKLDNKSISLIKAKKSPSANPEELVRNFEGAMALDTVRNEYMLHRQLHQWFIQGSQTQNVNVLNERVYSQLFLTPNSDPWLGLSPNNSYSAIDNDGIR